MKNNSNVPKSARTPEGRFAPGTSGNLSGRPPGSRDKTTLLVEQMIEDRAEQLTAKLLELADKGDMRALQLCLDRIAPARKERTVQFTLRPINGPQDVLEALIDVVNASAQGQITPAEAVQIANILNLQIDAYRTVGHEARIQELEAYQTEIENVRRAFHNLRGR